MNCKDCKHWKHHGEGAIWGDCKKIHDCSLAEINIKNSYDGEEITFMQTHSDFGCVLWEKK